MLHYSSYSYYITILLVYFCYLPMTIDRVKAVENNGTQFSYKSIFQNGLCSSLFDLEQCFVIENAIKWVVNEVEHITKRDQSYHEEKLLNISKQLEEVKSQNEELKTRVRKIEIKMRQKTKRNDKNSNVHWNSHKTQLNKIITKRSSRVRRDIHYIDPPNGYNHNGVYYYQYQTSATFTNQTKVDFR